MIKNTFTLKSLKSKCLTGKLSVPADKSISIRALLISSICFGNTRISNLLESEDVKNTLNCLKKLECCRLPTASVVVLYKLESS